MFQKLPDISLGSSWPEVSAVLERVLGIPDRSEAVRRILKHWRRPGTGIDRFDFITQQKYV